MSPFWLGERMIDRIRRLLGGALVLTLASWSGSALAAEPEALARLAPAYSKEIQPLLVTYCYECHSRDTTEAELDLAKFGDLTAIRKKPEVWVKIGEMLDSEQMPPKDEKQPTAAERAKLKAWVRELLTIEAAASAGDPGPVLLRRLSNAEYTYTLRDLTGVPSLDPAKEFPVDSAAGEGFTNVGNALVMSPALLTKYLDAAKDVAGHAVLLPDGIRFSPTSTRRDWTNESLARIRGFYGQYTVNAGASAVNLQGVQFDTNRGGRLPVEAYLAATLQEREALASGKKSFAEVARERKLNAKYLETLWQSLNAKSDGRSLPLDALRSAWKEAQPDGAAALTKSVEQWQAALWKFNSVGQIGRQGAAKQWLEGISPLAARQDFRLKLAPSGDGQEVVFTLAASDAGDGATDDVVVWERPRFVALGRPELLLRDIRRVSRELIVRRDQHFAQAGGCLNAAAEASAVPGKIDVKALAERHKVDADSLAGWLKYLGIGGEAKLGALIEGKANSGAGYDFVKGWVGADALSVVANSSDNAVRIPGNMAPHSVAVHPAPKFSVNVGWRAPQEATLKISGKVQHAHPECGNGVAWSVELRRGGLRQKLAEGFAQGAKEATFGPLEKVVVQPGDVVAIVIDPRDGNHSCDLTAIDITLHDGEQEWNLARDISPDILAGNPHADSHGNKDVWHFYSNPTGAPVASVPAGSLLAKWQTANAEEKPKLAADIQKLLQSGGKDLPANSPDSALYAQLTSLSGPLMMTALQTALAKPDEGKEIDSKLGVDPALFGKDPSGKAVDDANLCVAAPSAIEVRVPAALVAGAEFIAGGSIYSGAGPAASVQMQILPLPVGEGRGEGVTASPKQPLGSKTVDPHPNPLPRGEGTRIDVTPGVPILVRDGSPARERLEKSLDEFRQLFPPALCYMQIVPVDEVITLNLFYREDGHLRRLMLSDAEAKQLDRYWDELLFIAQEPIVMVDVYTQLYQFATQDRPDVVKDLIPLKQKILDNAAAFRERLAKCEPQQLDAVVALASQAYRRPATEAEVQQLRGLYANLRKEEISHEDALRLTLARMFVAPAFLYRLEQVQPGEKATPVNDYELATRLSYFLWSSLPDEELRSLAAAGKLHDPAVLSAQAKRMLQDPKSRRLATEFACQWLHIYDFDHHNEKSERHFPTFAALREAMYEESVLFFTDLFQHDRSVLNILDADYTFLNEPLAAHYGIPGLQGNEWRRVEGVKKFARGGVLTQATTLAKQSGASRTSPILRGNWLSEVVLGEKLPRPPKNVPQLADTVPEGLTERQLIERHSSDAACAKCHQRIDPFGFALESFDAIGRFRDKDAAGLAIDSKTALPDGTKLEGLAGLQKYLLTTRKQAFIRQFDKKLLGYALGRSVQLSDEPLLAELQTTLEKNDYRIGPAIELIVQSPQFRNIRGREMAKE
jgi:hypothetical protein